MNTALPATVVPPISTGEKIAMLGAAFAIGILLAIPFTRGLAVDSVVTVAHVVADTAVNAVRAIGSLVGLA